MWFCANIRLCEFRTQGYTDKCTICIRLFEILQITWGSHLYLQAFWDVQGARLETYCLDVDKIMKDFKKSHLGSPMRLTAFIILLNLINNLNVFAFFFHLDSPVNKPCNSFAFSCYRNGAMNLDWFVQNSFLSDTTIFKNYTQIVCENWVTVLYSN